MKVIEVREKCPSCKGTGLYVGMAERDGAAVVCSRCKGTGCHEFRYEYEDFVERCDRPGVVRVYQVNPGICIGAGNGHRLEEFGGLPVKEWKAGVPFTAGVVLARIAGAAEGGNMKKLCKRLAIWFLEKKCGYVLLGATVTPHYHIVDTTAFEVKELIEEAEADPFHYRGRDPLVYDEFMKRVCAKALAMKTINFMDLTAVNDPRCLERRYRARIFLAIRRK